MTGFYLYQTVHLLGGGEPRNLAAHAALLDAASRELFGRPYAPDLRRLAARLRAVAEAERYPRTVSGFVRIELTDGGEERLLPAGVSLYDGYALRSLMPDAATVTYEPPVTDLPTTAREAADLAARQAARRAGASVAVCRDCEGLLLSADDSPLFGIRGKRVLPGPAFPSVEREMVLRAVRASGLALCDEQLTYDLLPQLDELFYADHRGITSLAHCDGLPFMSLLAERIAGAMEALFPKM